jgi:hypothetical protein
MLQTAPTITPSPQLLGLDFEDLTVFEAVTEQYNHLGLHIRGAIAIDPSNPAFPPKSGSVVLMPASHEMIVTVSFDQPIAWMSVFVCSAGCVGLTAFDAAGNIVAHLNTVVSSSNLEPANKYPATWHGQQLELNRHGIARVMFHSSEPFILDDFLLSQIL